MLDEYNQGRITEEALIEIRERDRPHVRMRPAVFPENPTTWCALYGKNLQEGVAGFGDCPRTACSDFDRRWNWSQVQIDKYEAEKKSSPPPARA